MWLNIKINTITLLKNPNAEHTISLLDCGSYFCVAVYLLLPIQYIHVNICLPNVLMLIFNR